MAEQLMVVAPAVVEVDRAADVEAVELFAAETAVECRA